MNNQTAYSQIEPATRVFVAGHRGLAGSAIMRELLARGSRNIVTRSRKQLNLLNQAAVNDFFARNRPQVVYMAAALVGGIQANRTRGADFIYQNLMVQNNVIQSAWRYGVKRLLFLGSSCIYPRQCPQPMCEEHLLTGPLEITNEPYAVAKIAGVRMCQAYNRQYDTDFRSVMPTNLYGPNDSFDLQSCHVLPALVRRFDDAISQGKKTLKLWGSGSAMREFLHVDDLARACVDYMDLNDVAHDMINVGSGEEISIRELAELIAELSGFTGTLTWDISMPDGTPRKYLDSTRVRELGWQPAISLRDGIEQTIQWYRSQEQVA